jgi:hypothetical protein
MIYNFYRNGRFQAALKCTKSTVREYIEILKSVTYSFWTARLHKEADDD